MNTWDLTSSNSWRFYRGVNIRRSTGTNGDLNRIDQQTMVGVYQLIQSQSNNHRLVVNIYRPTGDSTGGGTSEELMTSYRSIHES